MPSSTLPTLHENSELSLDAGVGGVGQPAPSLSSLPASLMSSLTQANLSLTARKRYQVTHTLTLYPSTPVFGLLKRLFRIVSSNNERVLVGSRAILAFSGHCDNFANLR